MLPSSPFVGHPRLARAPPRRWTALAAVAAAGAKRELLRLAVGTNRFAKKDKAEARRSLSRSK